MNRLEVGKINNTHGLHGEVKVLAWTDSPDTFESIKRVYASINNEEITLTVKRVKYQKNNLIIKFNELESIEEAERLKGAVLTADREMLPPLPEGVYYIVDLIGCRVFDENNIELGTLADVFRAGAGNVYTVKRKGKSDLLLPANEETIISINTESEKIQIRVPEGLEDE
ncbi:MAG: 16S rRNA processing protein RimM [Clostridia bacterium]|nr:16S rRNA processing protein RimM [Clostridia bacterium]